MTSLQTMFKTLFMSKPAPINTDTRSALLECAERLFLTKGYAGVSIRQITRESGTNVASVNYHFNDKMGLFREVLATRLDQITDEKLTLLKALTQQQPAASLEEVLRAYTRSFFDSHLFSADSDRLMQIIYRKWARMPSPETWWQPA